MKNNIIKYAFMMLLSILFTNCDTNNTEIIDQQENKEIKSKDIPSMVEITFAEGHMHGTYAFHQNVDVDIIKHIRPVSKIKMINTDKGWIVEGGKKAKLCAMSSSKGVDAVYGLWIKYFNEKGEDITANYTTGGNENLYQHFFNVSDIRPTFDGVDDKKVYKTEEFLDYTYCDTNPWNKKFYKSGGEVKISGDTNPIGIKGYFKFKVERKAFNLIIDLKKYVSEKPIGDKVSPYYAPLEGSKFDDSFVSKITIPVIVYADITDTSDWEAEEDTPIEELNEADARYIRSLAKAYGITEKEAYSDMLIKVYGDYDREGGDLAF